MHALEIAAQPPQSHGAQEGDDGTAQRQRGNQDLAPQRQCGLRRHSITSPRSRNLAMAVEPTQPNSATSKAASK